MCLPAIGTALTGGALTAGSGAGLFAASLGLNLATGLAGRAAAQAAADQTYQSALIANRSAEQSFTAQQEATAAQLKESRASQAQEKLAKTIQGLQAKGAIRASEQAGLTVNMLLADSERQTANMRESINQAMESQSRQYTRVVRGLEAQRDNRRNQLQSNINQAYNQIPSLGSIILNTAAQCLSSFTTLKYA